MKRKYQVSFPELEEAAKAGAWGPAAVGLKFGFVVEIEEGNMKQIEDELVAKTGISAEEMWGKIKIEEVHDG